ncbi:MAG: hypothetical protein ABA06_02770 [Parcubacteria bacterium C7867-001]|nr:MAG: hypothetical protein ABA06_02770 [Parcubacteria bacterium C7867-001]
MELEKEIQQIKERNQRVSLDKAWETSLFRKLLVAVTTYVTAVIALLVIQAPNAYLGAVIPTLGFLLSTLTFPTLKEWWIKKYLR